MNQDRKMRRNITRIISVVMTAVLLVEMLTFCGGSKNETTTEETTTTVASVEAESLSMVELLEKATQSAEERSEDAELGNGKAKTETEAGNSSVTEAVNQTEAATEAQTEAATEVQTEATTEQTTEATTEAETEPVTIDNETPAQNLDGNAIFEDGTTTALGLSVPNNTRGTYFGLAEVTSLAGGNVWQDGSWYWLDASETTPQRGDIVVYTSQSMGGSPTHAAICVSGYAWSESDGCMKYMCIDGNYGPEPGSVYMGYSYGNTPNKGWTDSFSEAPGVEIGIGVWRSSYGELLAEGAEAAYYECQSIGQTAFLEKYIPEGVYGGWCYYLIAIAVNKVARGEY